MEYTTESSCRTASAYCWLSGVGSHSGMMKPVAALPAKYSNVL